MKCCAITAGMLRHAVTIERKTLTPDGIGGHVISWPVIKNLRVAITPLSGNESLQAQRLEAKLSHKIYARFFADLLPSDRINYKGRYFQIRAIINIEERNRWYELRCDEGVAQ